jgi:hypothetical protein
MAFSNSPVKAGLVEKAEECVYSSAQCCPEFITQDTLFCNVVSEILPYLRLLITGANAGGRLQNQE